MAALQSPLALWARLQAEAGLEILTKGNKPGRDCDFEEAVVARLGLGPYTGAGTLERYLAADAASTSPQIDTTRFLTEVLHSQQAFGAMMQDILGTLAMAGASTAEHVIEVEFKFGASDAPLRMTLEAFRQEVERVKRVLVTRPQLPDPGLLWPLRGKLLDVVDATAAPAKTFDPGFPPVAAPVATGNAALDEDLARLLEVVHAFRSWALNWGRSRREVSDATRALDDWQQSDDHRYGGAAHDNWDHGIEAWVLIVSERVREGDLDGQTIHQGLRGVFALLPEREVWVDQTFKEALDLLNLPTWQKRHELYSVWVGTVLLRTVANEVSLHFHVRDGVLSFAFGGNHLATYYIDGQAFHVWAEKRSELVAPSAKRTKEIQPDFRILRDGAPGTTGDATSFVLECKHYLTPSTRNFVAAANDYASSCPNAKVMLVNHGPADHDKLIASVGGAVAPRVLFLGNITALTEAKSRLLEKAIRERMFPERKAVAVGARTATGTAATLRLEWSADLEDLDLMLTMHNEGGQAEQVYFKSLGCSFFPPHARLHEDVKQGPGSETIEIDEWYFSTYVIEVNNYSKLGQMSAENVGLKLSMGNLEGTVRPPHDVGHLWRVAEIVVKDGEARIVPSSGWRDSKFSEVT